MMKKIIFILGIAILLMSQTSCNENETKTIIRGYVKGFNESCPAVIDPYSTITGLELNDDTLVYKVVTTEELWTVDMLRKNDNTTKKLMKFYLAQRENKDKQETMRKIAVAGLWIKWMYLGQKTNERYAFLMSPEEINEGFDKPMTQKDLNDEILKLMVARENSTCPSDLDNGMVLIKAEMEDNAIVYTVDVDEQLYDLRLFKYVEDEAKKDIGTYIATQKPFLNAMINTRRNLIYKYVGKSSGYAHSIVFNVPELEEMMK